MSKYKKTCTYFLLFIIVFAQFAFIGCGRNKNTPTREFVVPDGMHRIGADDYGFITLPKTWALIEEDSRNTILFENGENPAEYIRISLGRVDSDTDMEDVRRSLEISAIDSRAKIDYKNIVDLNSIEAWRMASTFDDVGRTWYAFLIQHYRIFSHEKNVVIIYVVGDNKSYLEIDGYIKDSYYIETPGTLATTILK